jgi:putative membrane protein
MMLKRNEALWLAGFFGVLAWSGYQPHDRFTWFLEVVPALIGLPILAATRRRFPLTPLLYGLILLHCWILMVGGKYTYAEVPAGFWLKDALGLARNPYDRLGHLAQGFIPAILAREIYIRNKVVAGKGWLFFLVLCTCLAFSAFYELLEWQTAVWKGEAAEAFLGTQGDVWDTQWDMAMAALGAVLAQLTLAGLHDGQMRRIAPARSAPPPKRR